MYESTKENSRVAVSDKLDASAKSLDNSLVFGVEPVKNNYMQVRYFEIKIKKLQEDNIGLKGENAKLNSKGAQYEHKIKQLTQQLSSKSMELANIEGQYRIVKDQLNANINNR